MLIKLTYTGKGIPTLVNLNNVKNIYCIHDKRTNSILTKVEYVDGSFINVVEDIKTIYEIYFNLMNGVIDMDWSVPTIDSMITNSYNKTTEYAQKNKRIFETY